jgi:hypothetical protein
VQATLAKKVLTKRYSRGSDGDGAYCTFFKITSKWGIKNYGLYKNNRDECFELQAKAAKYGFGPAVGECFDMVIDGQRMYCYTTRVAEPLMRPEDDEINYYGQNWDEEYNDVADIYNTQIEQLNEQMAATIGWRNKDMHLQNWGWLNDRVVCIDFGND